VPYYQEVSVVSNHRWLRAAILRLLCQVGILDPDIGPAFGETLYQMVGCGFMGIDTVNHCRIQSTLT